MVGQYSENVKFDWRGGQKCRYRSLHAESLAAQTYDQISKEG